jgi:hypothetical protein
LVLLEQQTLLILVELMLLHKDKQVSLPLLHAKAVVLVDMLYKALVMVMV